MSEPRPPRLGNRSSWGGVRSLVIVALLVGPWTAPPAGAWSAAGHQLVTRRALEAAADKLPPFLTEASEELADASLDPDLIRLRALPELRAREYPEHFLDRELLAGAALPPDRYDFLNLLWERKLDPRRVGMVPYAVIEATEHLAVALAELRLRPGDPGIEGKAVYLAGVVAHYAADMSQPLHTTIHYDGRVPEHGLSPRSGIHHLMDSLFERAAVDLDPGELGATIEPLLELAPEIETAFGLAHVLVDRVYELEADLEWGEDQAVPPAIQALAGERLRASVWLIASLWVSAVEVSKTLELPEWRTEQLQPSRE